MILTKVLLCILILIQSAALLKPVTETNDTYLKQDFYEVKDPTTLKEVKTIEHVIYGVNQGWNNRLAEVVFDKPVMIIGASLIACVSADQGVEVLLSTGLNDFSVNTYSNDTMFHLSSIYSQTGGQATSTVMLPRGFYYYVEAGEVLTVNLFANTPGDGGSFLIYYMEFGEWE